MPVGWGRGASMYCVLSSREFHTSRCHPRPTHPPPTHPPTHPPTCRAYDRAAIAFWGPDAAALNVGVLGAVAPIWGPVTHRQGPQHACAPTATGRQGRCTLSPGRSSGGVGREEPRPLDMDQAPLYVYTRQPTTPPRTRQFPVADYADELPQLTALRSREAAIEYVRE